MVLGFGLFIAAALLLQSGITGRSLAEIVRGEGSAGKGLFGGVDTTIISTAPVRAGVGDVVGAATAAAVGGSPKNIIDKTVIPIARGVGITVSVASVAAANARHGSTVSGSRSDHQGPPDQAWAADMSNGSSPTPAMDDLARKLAKTFNIPWSGSGVAEKTAGGYRYQMLYRTSTGGNHFNHVHFGVKKV